MASISPRASGNATGHVEMQKNTPCVMVLTMLIDYSTLFARRVNTQAVSQQLHTAVVEEANAQQGTVRKRARWKRARDALTAGANMLMGTLIPQHKAMTW